METIKVSQLPGAIAINDNDLMILNQSGTTRTVSARELAKHCTKKVEESINLDEIQAVSIIETDSKMFVSSEEKLAIRSNRDQITDLGVQTSLMFHNHREDFKNLKNIDTELTGTVLTKSGMTISPLAGYVTEDFDDESGINAYESSDYIVENGMVTLASGKTISEGVVQLNNIPCKEASHAAIVADELKPSSYSFHGEHENITPYDTVSGTCTQDFSFKDSFGRIWIFHVKSKGENSHTNREYRLTILDKNGEIVKQNKEVSFSVGDSSDTVARIHVPSFVQDEDGNFYLVGNGRTTNFNDSDQYTIFVAKFNEDCEHVSTHSIKHGFYYSTSRNLRTEAVYKNGNIYGCTVMVPGNTDKASCAIFKYNIENGTFAVKTYLHHSFTTRSNGGIFILPKEDEVEYYITIPADSTIHKLKVNPEFSSYQSSTIRLNANQQYMYNLFMNNPSDDFIYGISQKGNVFHLNKIQDNTIEECTSFAISHTATNVVEDCFYWPALTRSSSNPNKYYLTYTTYGTGSLKKQAFFSFDIDTKEMIDPDTICMSESNTFGNRFAKVIEMDDQKLMYIYSSDITMSSCYRSFAERKQSEIKYYISNENDAKWNEVSAQGQCDFEQPGNTVKLKIVFKTHDPENILPSLRSISIRTWNDTDEKVSSSELVSKDILVVRQDSKVVVTADQLKNDGNIEWFISLDQGMTWRSVELASQIVLEQNIGSIKLKARLSADVDAKNLPVVRSFNVQSAAVVFHSDIESMQINLMKTNFKIDTYTNAAKNNLLKMTIDTFSTEDGIDKSLSRYTFDSTHKLVHSGHIVTVADDVSESVSRLLLTSDEIIDSNVYSLTRATGGEIKYYASKDDGATWKQIVPGIANDISSLNNGAKLRIKAEIIGDAKLNAIGYAWN